MDDYLTPAEVAEKLQVAESTVFRWTREKRIPFIKIGQIIRIPREAIENLVQHPIAN